ncbi:MAG: D-sedoheptulose 7-phosphate isomerase [Bacteriovoracales bacterium]
MRFIESALTDAKKTLESILSNQQNLNTIEASINELVLAYTAGNKVFSCGNGGSMCDSMHFAEELTGRFRKDRASLPAISISDAAHLSCVSNDFGYEHVFDRFISGWGQKGDILLAISTSGNSRNVILAAIEARKKGMKIIGLLGKNGGELKNLVDYPIIVESQVTDRIQEIHIKIIHIFIEGIERSLFPQNYT